MKLNKNDLNKPWLAYTVATCSAVVLFVFLSNLRFWGKVALMIGEFIYPIFLAAVIAFILNPLVHLFSQYVFNGIKRESLRRSLSIAATVLALILFIVLLIILLIPPLVSSITAFASNFDSYMTQVREFLNLLSNTDLAHDLDLSEFISSGGSFLNSVSSIIPQSLNSIVTKSIGFTKTVAEAVIAFILAIYFLTAKDNLLSGFKFMLRAILSDAAYPSTVDFLRHCHDIFVRYIAFDLLDGVIIGAANWVFMAIMNMPYAALLSFIVGVTNLAPTFGPIIGAVIGGLILVLVDPWYAFWFLIFTVILQTLDGYIIKPRLFGDSLGVSPVLLMVSIIVFGRIFGVVGILLSIPLAAIIDYIYRTWLYGMLQKSKDAHEREHAEHVHQAEAEALAEAHIAAQSMAEAAARAKDETDEHVDDLWEESRDADPSPQDAAAPQEPAP